MFGLVIFVLRSLLGVARQWSREKFAILTLKPWSHVRILTYQTWAIYNPLSGIHNNFSVMQLVTSQPDEVQAIQTNKSLFVSNLL